MRPNVIQCITLIILTTTLCVVEAQGQELTVSDTQNSGCLSRVSSYDGVKEPNPTIILEKEGDVLTVQLLNYQSNCATFDFEVKSNVNEDCEGSACSLSVIVNPVAYDYADCICPFNVSFTVQNLKQSRFYLTCWWYEGLVELTEGEPLVIEDVKENITIDGMNYTLRKAFHHAMVARNEWSGEVCIPSELNYEGQTYTVTSISKETFRDNAALTKVTFPRTVKNMDFSKTDGFYSNPFIGCTALETIEVEEGNPVLCAVDGVLFNKEKTKLYCHPAAANRKTYTVPEGVTWIEGLAFSKNQHLVSVVIPDEATSLGYSAFYECTKLEDVKLPSHLTALAGWTFGNCKRLKSVTIPEGVTFLGGNLFSGCSSLTSVTMPESVTSTDYSVFENCISLKSVTLSPNLNRINNNLFLNCSSLKEIIIPEGIAWLGSYAFQNCTALKTLDLPESVCRIGEFTFSGCKLDSLLIRGIIDSPWCTSYLFDGMGTQTKVFVQPSEVEKYKKLYKGPVYPLPEETNNISDILRPATNPSELYDLQGRRIFGEPNRGIYISKGRKRVVK